MKILLVQDGTKDTVLRQCLLERGGELLVCGSSGQAQEVLQREPLGLVVVDLEDEADAIELCRWIWNRPNRESRFVVLGLGGSSGQTARKMLGSGADEVLFRPYDTGRTLGRLASVEHQIQRRAEWQRKLEGLNTLAQQQVAIAALGHCALSQDLKTLIDSAGWSIIYTLQAELWNLAELSQDGKSLKLVAGFGWPEGSIGLLLPPPPVQSLTGRSLGGEDVISADTSEGGEIPATDFARACGVASGISVAIRGKANDVFGVLEAYTTKRRVFVEDELRFMEGLSHVIGAAMERQRHEAEVQKHQSQVQHLQRLESVGQLAAGLAHDYNNVLTIIHGHVTLALGEPKLPPKISGSLKLVLEAVERAAHLTRQMLTFSRKQSLKPGPVDLNSVVQSIAKLLDRVLGSAVRLQIDPAPGLPAVQADTGMLDQVLMNLAVNARDAMPKGGKLLLRTGVVTLDDSAGKRHPDARAGEFVCLSVSDTGCGMDETTLRHIFDPFFTTKEPGKGTGLGLSTVYGIVKQHQGWIEVESQPGRGTTFSVFLPSLARPVESPATRVEATAARGGSETLLLVEDEPTLRQLARLLLEDLGYQVLDAGSGREALEIWSAHKHQIQVLVTDLVMPDGLTGFELADRLQQEEPKLNVVFTSGYSPDQVSKSLPSGRGYQFVQKPYQTESLGRAVRESLTGERTGTESER